MFMNIYSQDTIGHVLELELRQTALPRFKFPWAEFQLTRRNQFLKHKSDMDFSIELFIFPAAVSH